MTITTTANITIDQGNGVTTSFNYSFLIPAASDVEVFYTDINGVQTPLATTQYSISGIGNPDGGFVIYPLSGSPIAIGTYITIIRSLPLLQLTTISNQGAFYPAVVESALDYLMMAIQQVNSEIVELAPGMAIIANIAALRLNFINYTTVFVEGYSTPADGGEGIFVLNTLDTTSADNGGTIIVNVNNARWYRAENS